MGHYTLINDFESKQKHGKVQIFYKKEWKLYFLPKLKIAICKQTIRYHYLKWSLVGLVGLKVSKEKAVHLGAGGGTS